MDRGVNQVAQASTLAAWETRDCGRICLVDLEPGVHRGQLPGGQRYYRAERPDFPDMPIVGPADP